MQRNQPTTRWPYVVIAVVLFGLSVAAPIHWQHRFAQDERVEHGIAPGDSPSRGARRAATSSTLVTSSASHRIEPSIESELANDDENGGGQDDCDEENGDDQGAVRVASDENSGQPTLADPPAAAPLPASHAPNMAGGGHGNSAPTATAGADPASTPTDADSQADASAPLTLLQQLAHLAQTPAARPWAEQIAAEVRILGRVPPPADGELEMAGARLAAALDRVEPVLATVGQEPLRGEIRRVCYAALRRLDVWRLVHATAAPPRVGPRVAMLDRGQPVVDATDLEPVDPAVLLSNLEQYEQLRRSSLARVVANHRRRIAAQHDEPSRKLAAHLETHYRNANVRVALDGRLLNRLVPQPAPIEGEVDDVVTGVPVQGWQRTATRMHVRLLPDRTRIRLGLEAHGDVSSETSATSGPATIYNDGQTRYLARKLLVLDGRRLHAWPAVSEADNETVLSGIRTNFDPIPLVGPIVQSIARSQHDSRRDQARWEVESKVSDRSREELDRRAAPGIERLQQQLDERVLVPLTKLSLDPTAIGLSTTEDRIIARYRLAGPDQLGAHTARPRAPGDSLFSVQVHETAVNNALANLQLDGHTFELRKLYEAVAARMGRAELKVPEDVPEGVMVTFADRDAVQLRFDQGKVEVRLKIAEIVAQRKHWRNLTVLADYEPKSQGLDAQFAREQPIRLSGAKLSTKSSVALRAIFSRMFTRNRTVHLVPEAAMNDPRLADLCVNQLVVEDGWIGLSLGPSRGHTNGGSKPSKAIGAPAEETADAQEAIVVGG